MTELANYISIYVFEKYADIIMQVRGLSVPVFFNKGEQDKRRNENGYKSSSTNRHS
jgi:hypothetical protein